MVCVLYTEKIAYAAKTRPHTQQSKAEKTVQQYTVYRLHNETSAEKQSSDTKCRWLKRVALGEGKPTLLDDTSNGHILDTRTTPCIFSKDTKQYSIESRIKRDTNED